MPRKYIGGLIGASSLVEAVPLELPHSPAAAIFRGITSQGSQTLSTNGAAPTFSGSGRDRYHTPLYTGYYSYSPVTGSTSWTAFYDWEMNAATYPYLASYGTTSGAVRRFYTHNTDIRAYRGDGTTYPIMLSGLTDGQRYRAAFRWDGTNLKSYLVSGTAEITALPTASATTTEDFDLDGNTHSIGVNSTNNVAAEDLDSPLYAYAFYSSALTDSKMVDVFNTLNGFDFLADRQLRTSGVFNLGSLGRDGPASGDAEFDNVVLLLDGTSTTDKSSANTGLTNNGVAVNQNSQSHPYASGALLFDGTDGLTITSENDNLYLGTDDWTIEGWFRTTDLSDTNTILEYRTSGSDNGAGKMFIGVTSNSATTGQVGIYENTVYQAQSATGAITTNTWYHLAFVRNGGTVSVFIDGSLADSGTLSSSTVEIYRPTSRPIIGDIGWSDLYNWIGEWVDFRITKGVARYTSNFTPPTSALTNTVSSGTVVLRLDGDGTSGSTTFTDKSNASPTIAVNGNPEVITSVKKFGTGSIDLDGTGDYLEVDFQDNIGVSGDPFTVECWVYFDTLFDDGVINLTQGGFGQGGNSLAIGYYSSQWRFYDDNTGTAAGVTPGPSTGQWYHTAIVFNGTDLVFYINGQARLTRLNHASNMPPGGYPTVIFGGYYGAGYELDGKIDDIRVTKGAALYPDTGRTGELAPPTSALPTTGTVAGATKPTRKWGGMVGRSIAVTTETVLDADFDKVVLLLDGNGTNNQTTFTDLSTVQTPITTFGNTHVDTTVKKFGSGSIEFDGNGDYLRTEDFGLTSGDFTIEAWVNLKAMPTSDAWPAAYNSWMEIVGVGTFNLGDGWQFRIGTTQLAFGTNSDTTAVTGTHGMSTGTWYHLAVTRSGNVYTVYVDGSSVGSATYTAQQPGSGAYGWVGAETGQGAYLNGYIDDLRITKGVARYGGSFTPPTSALTNTVSSGTVVLRLDGDGTNGQTTFTDQSSSPITVSNNSNNVQVDTGTKKFGSGSIKFDSTTDWLYFSDLSLGTDNFTIETWLNADLSASPRYAHIIGNESAGIVGWTWMINGNTASAGDMRLYSNGSLLLSTASGVLTTNTWHHIALTKRGDDLEFFVDGISVATDIAHSSNFTNVAASTTIGANLLFSPRNLVGYMDDFRITKGAALYPFLLPTSALPTTGTVSTTNAPNTGILSLPELLQASYSPVRVSSASVGPRTSTDGTYTFYTFTSTSAQYITFSTESLVDILLVGGGGGAGDTIGGGGGGGEVIVAKNIKVSAQQYSVSVGAGGTAGTRNDGTNDAGNAGSSTTFSGAGFTTLTAVGGGGGGADTAGQVATAGANGGGGAFQTNQTGATGSGTTISAGTHGSSSTYSIYSGNSGGNGYINGGNTLHEGGGGAGAGSDGDDATQLSGKSGGADGGSGVLVADFDGSYYYGGGGGGASYQYNSPGAGGAGGGGGGGTNSTTTNADQGLGDTQGRNNGGNGNAPTGSTTGFSDAFGGAGGANTGGGGGAAGYAGNSAAGAGGSGIVIVRITN